MLMLATRLWEWVKYLIKLSKKVKNPGKTGVEATSKNVSVSEMLQSYASRIDGEVVQN